MNLSILDKPRSLGYNTWNATSQSHAGMNLATAPGPGRRSLAGTWNATSGAVQSSKKEGNEQYGGEEKYFNLCGSEAVRG